MKEAIFNNFDIWAAVTVVIIILGGLYSGRLLEFYRSPMRVSFKLMVSCLIVSCLAFLFLFLGGLWFILGHTSFVNHIRDGDLWEHLNKGL